MYEIKALLNVRILIKAELVHKLIIKFVNARVKKGIETKK